VRYALISDIHGNLESLAAVLAQLDAADTLYCLGDLVGYGPNPNECIELVRARAAVSILGNHDVAAIDDHGLEYFNGPALDAIRFTKAALSDDNRAWLDALSYEARMPGFLLVHGAPVEYFAYTNDKAAASRAFEATDAPIIFLGHTHIAEWYSCDERGRIEHAHVQRGGTLTFEREKRYIVNVGSVGQPRDLNPEASFAIYDEAAQCVTWERVPYSIDRVREKICAAHLPVKLGERLARGR
jgi:predicted phosphodiesterase